MKITCYQVLCDETNNTLLSMSYNDIVYEVEFRTDNTTNSYTITGHLNKNGYVICTSTNQLINIEGLNTKTTIGVPNDFCELHLDLYKKFYTEHITTEVLQNITKYITNKMNSWLN